VMVTPPVPVPLMREERPPDVTAAPPEHVEQPSPTSPRRRSLVAAGIGGLVAAAAVFVTGALLGGGDDPVDPTTPPTTEPNIVIASTLGVDAGPTRAEWALAADQVCLDAGPDAGRFSEDMHQALQAVDPVAYEQGGYGIYNLTRRAVDEIGAITPQADDVAQVDQMLEQWENMIEYFRVDLDAFLADESERAIGQRIAAAVEANTIARELGALECALLFQNLEQA
jgi:hypothetical protein